ncbi:MAG TPA: hypothetical protein VN980_04005, partial [Alphaproteobacteria bacterium]|nr:hypothetical protein [Alphaproteobacteria bacterium]
ALGYAHMSPRMVSSFPRKAGIHSLKWRDSVVLDARFRGHDERAVERERDFNLLNNKENSRCVNPLALARG